jgi:anaerobic ribonucleoside-triphosphate reductase activating protein
MNIVSTQYTLSTKSMEIYLAGCSGQPKCKGCHNPELWNFNIGDDWRDKIKEIVDKCKDFKDMVDNIMIFGGEPMDNDVNELSDFLIELNIETNLNIWLFTRYELSNIPIKVSCLCNYIKCGKYKEELITDNNVQYGIKLATSNQNIYKRGVDY